MLQCPDYKEQEMITQSEYTGTQVLQVLKQKSQQSVLELIESLFSDLTIYNNSTMKQLVMGSEKGYIPIQILMSLPQYQSFIDANPHLELSAHELLRLLATESKKLVVCNDRVRRSEPFVDCMDGPGLKLVYVDRLPARPTIEIYQFFRNIVGNVYQIYHKKHEKWAIIAIDNYEALQAVKDNLFIGDHKIFIFNPVDTLSCYGESQRLSSDFNIVKLYENKAPIDMERQNQDIEELARGNQMEMEMVDEMGEGKRNKPFMKLQSRNIKGIQPEKKRKQKKKQNLFEFNNSALLRLRDQE